MAALAPIASEIVICAPAGYEKQIQELVGAEIKVVVASTETFAPPSAADSVEIASLLRPASFGRLPIICTVTFEIT